MQFSLTRDITKELGIGKWVSLQWKHDEWFKISVFLECNLYIYIYLKNVKVYIRRRVLPFFHFTLIFLLSIASSIFPVSLLLVSCSIQVASIFRSCIASNILGSLIFNVYFKMSGEVVHCSIPCNHMYSEKRIRVFVFFLFLPRINQQIFVINLLLAFASKEKRRQIFVSSCTSYEWLSATQENEAGWNS